MRYALLSDVHSNLEALNATLEALKKENIDKYVCLGDVVGYAASPNECTQIIRELTDAVIMGNHDSAALGLTSIDEFNPLAKKAIAWTARELSTRNKKYLESLEVNLELKGSLAVHSSPSDPQMWRYVFTTEDARAEFHHFTQKICFIGHSHQPLTFVNSKERAIADTRPILEIEKGNRYIVNIGSVGQPRDFDPRASYAIYDTTPNIVEIKRVEYDVATARRRIIEAGLPRYLGDRLLTGR